MDEGIGEPALQSERQGFLHTDELRLLIDAVEDYAIFLLSPSGRILSWNRGAERVMGYQQEEVIGRHFSIFYDEKALAEGKPDRELASAGESGRIEDEGWRVRKGGERFFVNTVITRLLNPDGSVRGFAKITRDLTQKRYAEEELRRSEEMLRLLVASVKDYAIFLLDPDGRVATWNAGARNIKGYEADEIIGQHFSVFYPEEDIRAHKPERELELATKYGSLEDEGWRLRKNGARFFANVVITAVFDERRVLRGFAKVTRDVTDRRTTEEMQRIVAEQREARLRAESTVRASQEANRAKDNFLMTLSHELRTPMTSILGWSRLLPTLDPGTPSFQDGIDAITRSAVMQAQLIDDLLDVSRIVAGKLRLEMEEVDVKTLISQAVDVVRPAAEAKGIKISIAIAKDIGTAKADRTRFHQIVWNLLTNAVKFTPRGGSIRATAASKRGLMEITVSDDGEGIDPDFVPHLFEPFRQSENPSTRVHGGLGLGLSIVRYLVEAHGGSIRVSSGGRGKGASFTFTLPLEESREKRGESQEAQNTSRLAEGRLGGVRIMVIDDDHDGRLLVKTALQQAGAHVVAMESAPLAVEEFTAHPCDIVITDIAMPTMDGYEVAATLRKISTGTPLKVVALSAFHPQSHLPRDAFDEYLSKPIDPFSLVDAIVRVAGR